MSRFLDSACKRDCERRNFNRPARRTQSCACGRRGVQNIRNTGFQLTTCGNDSGSTKEFTLSHTAGTQLRLQRILNHETGNGIIVAIDHGLFIGPLPGVEQPAETIQKLLPGRPDAIQMTPGITRACIGQFYGKQKPGIVVRLDATNIWRKKPAPKEGYYTPVASVRDAVQLGGDAVVTFLFAGYDTDAQEAENLQALSRIGAEAREYGIPFIVEPLAVEKGSNVVRDFEVMKLIVRMASEIGADLIKADYPETKQQFEQLVAVATVPILVRGGPKMDSDKDMLQMVSDAMNGGARGIVFGRNVWQHKNPASILRALGAVVHERADVQKALLLLRE
jgi:class I fructose-bisphosphate aldolase